MSRPLVLSLFPGIGLLDMAFEEVGFCVVPLTMGRAVAAAVRRAATLSTPTNPPAPQSSAGGA